MIAHFAPPVQQPMPTLIDCSRMDFVAGDATGLLIPAHAEALRTGGVKFLTDAFRAFGSLPATNRVTQITRFETCPGGSTGQKLFLSVEYEEPDPQLHTRLFIKFSRDFSDPVRDARGKHEMEGEVRFAAVSRLPHHPKCLDHEIDDPLAHYRVIVKSLARVAAAHRSGRLSADIDVRFPYDAGAAAANNPISYDQRRLHDLVAQFAAFVRQCPQLFPAAIGRPSFFARLAREAGRFLENEVAIRRFLQSDHDLIALCHWNANIDNAWFWRDSADELQCGLMDWGHVGRMNVAFALWGSLSGAGLDLWNHHLDELLGLFVDELRERGGPVLAVARLKLHLQLYVALMGLSYFLESPARILFRLPAAVAASGPRDPLFLANETARNQLHISTVFLNLWEAHDLGASLDRMQSE
jgi:hypothetical protein